jgi:D-glycero-D-manno-heptose 1,7-bisphosphate phosphatase
MGVPDRHAQPVIMNKAIFLDRDGTINVTPQYDEVVNSLEKLVLHEESIRALRLLSQKQYKVFIVTNQSGISQGLLTEKLFWQLHQNFLEMIIPSGLVVTSTVMCPHRSDDKCKCRKPQTTLVKPLIQKYQIDLKLSYTIGDRDSDIEMGNNLGTKTILVNRGGQVLQRHPDIQVTNLYEAILRL